MDKVSDILTNVKERLSNPLIFSFVLAWLVYNWKIPVALLWFDKKQISDSGYNNILEFIEAEWRSNGDLWRPLGIALIYTVFLPVVKNLYRLLNSLVYKYADNLDLKILKGSVVSIEKHLKFRELYLKRTEELDTIIKDEQKYLTENNEIRNELFIANENLKKNLELKIELNEIINKIDDVSILNGIWKCTYTYNDNDNIIEEVQIRFGRYEVIGSENKIYHKFDIVNFFNDSRKKRIFFVKKMTRNAIGKLQNRDEIDNFDIYKFNVLRIENDELLTGQENDSIAIRYEKVSNLTFNE